MDRQVARKKWADALRSYDDARRGRSTFFLRVGDAMSAWGVGCDASGLGEWQEPSEKKPAVDEMDESPHLYIVDDRLYSIEPPPEVLSLYGFSEAHAVEIAQLNAIPESFARIADYIETPDMPASLLQAKREVVKNGDAGENLYRELVAAYNEAAPVLLGDHTIRSAKVIHEWYRSEECDAKLLKYSQALRRESDHLAATARVVEDYRQELAKYTSTLQEARLKRALPEDTD